MHENRSKFFKWCKIISNQLTVNDVICDVVFVNNILNPPISNQNNRVWAGDKKADVKPVPSSRLLAEREKFAQHVMVSAGVCFGGKGRLHFVDESAKVDSAYYVGQSSQSWPRLHSTVAQWIHLTARWRASTHSSNWLQTNCPDRFAKDQWPPNSPFGLPCLRDNVEAYHKRHPKPENDRRSRTEGSPACDLGQPTSATNSLWHSCQRVLKATKGLRCSWRWTFRTYTVTAMSRLCYFCLNDIILLRDCLDIFKRAKIARWQHCNADNFRTL